MNKINDFIKNENIDKLYETLHHKFYLIKEYQFHLDIWQQNVLFFNNINLDIWNILSYDEKISLIENKSIIGTYNILLEKCNNEIISYNSYIEKLTLKQINELKIRFIDLKPIILRENIFKKENYKKIPNTLLYFLEKYEEINKVEDEIFLKFNLNNKCIFENLLECYNLDLFEYDYSLIETVLFLENLKELYKNKILSHYNSYTAKINNSSFEKPFEIDSNIDIIKIKNDNLISLENLEKFKNKFIEIFNKYNEIFKKYAKNLTFNEKILNSNNFKSIINNTYQLYEKYPLCLFPLIKSCKFLDSIKNLINKIDLLLFNFYNKTNSNSNFITYKNSFINNTDFNFTQLESLLNDFDNSFDINKINKQFMKEMFNTNFTNAIKINTNISQIESDKSLIDILENGITTI